MTDDASRPRDPRSPRDYGPPSRSRQVTLEIAVQDVAGVRTARASGAQRVELCVALGATGGLTPSVGLVDVALAVAEDFTDHEPIEVHPLIRPRAGGFVYDRAELDVALADVRAFVDAGAHGVVVGALTADGRVDVEAVRALVAAAEGREVTFHRALDAVPDVFRALDTLAALGVARVLTSGGEARSIDGLEQLRRCAGHVHDEGLPVQVQAGGGVRVADIAALVAAGVDAVHLSAKSVVHDAAGPGGAGEYEVTDAGLVVAARDALDAALTSD